MPSFPLFLAALLTALLAAMPAQAFDLAITLDDLPWSGTDAEAQQDLPLLLAALRAAPVPLTGFTVCDRARDLPAGLQSWRDAGVEIAHHSAAHRDFNTLSLPEWRDDTTACQRQLSTQGNPPRFYRFPLLHSGNDTTKRDGARAHLQTLGLRPGPVSVDTSDWLLAVGYRKLTTPAQRERAGALLVDHVLRSLRQARRTAQERYARDPAQILLLHANGIVAAQWPALITALRAEGARFVTLEQALADPIYALRDDYAGPKGLSWLYRTAPAQPERAAWDDAEAARLRAALEVIAGDTTTLTEAQPYSLAGASTLQHRGSDGRERVAHIWLPAPPAGQRLPVIVALDGDYAFPLLQAIVRHYLDRGEIPPTAVIGISYPGADTDLLRYRETRSRDYTPSYTLSGGYSAALQAESGNAAQFRDILLDELLPQLAARYPLDLAQASYVGHSYGGLFGAFLLATRPQAFTRYTLVSPSLWYDDGVAFRLLARQRFDAAGAPKVFLSVGGLENPNMAADLRRYAGALATQGLPQAQLRMHVFDEDTHNSIFPAAFTASLRWFESRR
ncbi:MAG: polysaccharide deacetylase family protein [Rhodanobacteraceae bacterium]|nr:polysaccharide deacetylase family protein [Rhodanobacteraceae bacterium]